mgnify:FL=1
MTYEEYLQEQKKKKSRRPPRDEEHRLQCDCVSWFCLQYPAWRGLLFAVPNGGRRDGITGKKLKDEGVVPGVSDLLLLYPSGKYHALCVEMKTPKGRQSEVQKAWQRAVERAGYKYALCRSLADFITTIEKYLAL